MGSVMPQVITQLKIVAWLYIICSIATFFILVISFMQGKLHFYFNNANCAVECFTNPLHQNIPNVVELDNDYKTCHEDYIILQDENENKDNQLSDTDKEKNDRIKTLNKTCEDCNTCKMKLDMYEESVKYIRSIDSQIQNMETCNSYLKAYCDCLKDEDHEGAERYFTYLKCEDILPQNYYNNTKASYDRLLNDVLMTRKNLTDLLITGNFKKMLAVYEPKKDLATVTDNCHFMCNLEVEDLHTTYWRTFEDGWKLFSEYFLKA